MRPKIVIAVAVVVLLLLVLVRALAPWGIERYANHRLAGLAHYRGHIRDVDLHVLGGAVVIRRFVLDKRNADNADNADQPGGESGGESGGGPVHFVEADRIEIDLRWGQLLRGRRIADISVSGPTVVLIRDPDATKRQLGQDIHWDDLVGGLPFRLGKIEGRDGSLRVRGVGNTGQPMVFDELRFSISGLAAPKAASEQSLPAMVELSTRAFGKGKMTASGKFRPSLASPDFDAKAHLRPLPLGTLDPWLEAKAGAKAKDGELMADASARLRDSRLTGYVEGTLHNPKIEPAPAAGGPLDALKAWAAKIGLHVVENDQGNLHERVPIDTHIDLPREPTLKQTASRIARAAWDDLRKNFELPGG